MFRDADTVEVHCPRLASAIWERVKHLVPFRDVVIAPEDDGSEEWERELVGTWSPSGLNSDFLFAAYPTNGSFAPHTDGRAIHDFNNRSFYSVVIYLNDIPLKCGGGTKFYERGVTKELFVHPTTGAWTAHETFALDEVDPIHGRMLIFNQKLVHEGVPVIEGNVKHIIRSDIMYERTPKVFDSVVDQKAYELFKKAELLGENPENVDESIVMFKRALKMSPSLASFMGHA